LSLREKKSWYREDKAKAKGERKASGNGRRRGKDVAFPERRF